MSYTTWSLVYGEQPSTAKWNILGTNDAHFYGFLGDNLEWQSWTPTLANMSKGNGTINAYYTTVGKTVIGMFQFVLGSTSTMGTNPTFTSPSTAVSRYTTGFGSVGGCLIVESGASSYPGMFIFATTTTILVNTVNSSAVTYATRGGITSTAPFTWGTNDYISGTFSYEAA